MNVALHLLYDLGGRLQDLLKMQYGAFEGNQTGWVMQKVQRSRQGAITEETKQLIQQLQKENGK